MEGNLRFKIDWASLTVGKKFTVFASFTLYLRAISKDKPPGGLYLEGRFNGGFFGVTSSGGGLIFLYKPLHAYTWRGLFYFRNFTVCK